MNKIFTFFALILAINLVTCQQPVPALANGQRILLEESIVEVDPKDIPQGAKIFVAKPVDVKASASFDPHRK